MTQRLQSDHNQPFCFQMYRKNPACGKLTNFWKTSISSFDVKFSKKGSIVNLIELCPRNLLNCALEICFLFKIVWLQFLFYTVLWNVVKIGVLRLIKIILRWSTFDIETRILHNSRWINRIWMRIQLDQWTWLFLKVILSTLESASGETVMWVTLGTCSDVNVGCWVTTVDHFKKQSKHWASWKSFFSEVFSNRRPPQKLVSANLRNIKMDVGEHFVATWNIFLRDLHPMYNSSIKVTQETF